MKSLEAVFGPNSALVEELYNQYREDPSSVPGHWQRYFDEIEGDSSARELAEAARNGDDDKAAAADRTAAAPQAPAPAKPAPSPDAVRTQRDGSEEDLPSGATLEKIKGIGSKIAENMDESLEMPTATSVRVLPMKMLIEDRDIINSHLLQRGEPKASFTHFIAWAIVQALEEFPNMNNSFLWKDGTPYRAVPKQVNLGLAIDVQNKDGSRNLLVPNIKGVDTMNFREFLHAYADLVEKARSGNLQLEDFQGTTLTLTNPGMIGTVQSVPRLMKNQGTIIATGAIDYPAEYQSMSQEVLNKLGISKVMTVTSTYDHRVIQGAESGSFLKKIHSLLNGEENFYDQIFSDLEIPYDPLPYGEDTYVGQLDGGSASLEQNKRAIAVMRLINMYRTRGHVLADLDPLSDEPGHNPELELEYYGLTLWDMDREFYCGGLGGYEKAPLRTIIKLLRDTYCGKIGAEFMHLLDLEERKWLRERMESTANKPDLDKDDKEQIVHKLNQAKAFEQFLHKKYIGHKRFSLEGADTLIPMMHFLLENAGDAAVEKIYMGMAHRGRLNILVNIMNKPYRKVFADFEGNLDPDSIQGSGDVKYHLGARGEHRTGSDKRVEIELLPNPSHLESVNPVVEGSARATQDHLEGGNARNRILPVLIHGDAAFSGQGVVAETLNMSQLDAYQTGGTVHIIINNQIGFTTLPRDGRSTQYASDLAKMILAPIFHVNGDSPEEAVHAIQMAFEYRQKFGKDVVIDLTCFRKHGHNEGDEPAFTQPGMYKEIDNHPTVRDIYTRQLLRKGELTEEQTEGIFEEFDQLLQEAFEDAKNASPLEVSEQMMNRHEMTQSEWPDYPDTTCPEEDLKDIAVKLNTVPKDFDANPKLLKQLAKRAEIVDKNEKKIDWGFAEALAFGSLLKSGTTVRLTGQDAERGTFSHRHAILHGTETDQKFIPLNNLSDDQAPFYPYNSLLSEFACVGFEFGYSAAKLEALVIWEAQFGDFANGAQVPIDQFISASEAKWGQKSALVMTLPHGYEGQGPEHSSARLERYLQLCAEDNMQVVNLTTPAQYFHILRKQALQENKKPLIIMSPKSLLRHPMATSATDDLAGDGYRPFIGDPKVGPEKAERLVLCSGKVYYDLIKHREENEIENVALARLEQFYPFPDRDVSAWLESYSGVSDVVWCQEEPKNMGAWTFLFPRLQARLAEGQELRYVGRKASASPAAGHMKIHQAEQERLVSQALRTGG
ncbi:MAG: multifunctional oxoglutarate decarboxylase/oxoglutarate dehydrogenase thiamine pyrophosphate-binding subunit/dihydrolipoyllysine-residue succinyltransferase subunit [Balneolaceae bacterium]|nr:multifunctional oxoglutarate decarboxylase/oxoglutarate dehydrogenase thiamine pyrophosphate-binding subunit/dihydrolipoyllysine-residue succinyltransferase subunit [Balneolaceae bacterium]